jgi:aspartyl protease family protein
MCQIKNLTVLLYLCIFFAVPSFAADDVYLVGVFGKKALLSIDGSQTFLSKGVATKGVTLQSLDSEKAVVLIGDKEETLYMGARPFKASSGKKTKESKTVQIVRNNSGMYSTVGSINGRTVSFLVDTGATYVAMNANEAKRLGIPFRLKGKKGAVATASGTAKAYVVSLKTVQVGGIKLSNIKAVVLDGSSPKIVLLGLSFLDKLQMVHEGNKLVLTKKY